MKPFHVLHNAWLDNQCIIIAALIGLAKTLPIINIQDSDLETMPVDVLKSNRVSGITKSILNICLSILKLAAANCEVLKI